jgi:uncharacterized protein YjiS (DUF1127 family)
MLANQIAKYMPSVLVFPELDFIGRLFANGDQYIRRLSASKLFSLLEKDHKIGDVGFSRDEWMEISNKSAGQGIHSLLNQIVKSYSQRQERAIPDVVLFQRGTLLSVVPEISSLLPSAKFIHIIRDPRAAISSIVGIKATQFKAYNRKRMGRGDALGLGKNWVKYTQRVQELLESLPNNILQVQYEEVCRNQEKNLNCIADFISVPYSIVTPKNNKLKVGTNEHELHKYIDKAPVLERLDAWKKELDCWRGYLVEFVIGKRLSLFGYEPFFSIGISTAKRLRYLIRGLLEYCIESVGPFYNKLSILYSDPRLFFRMLKIKMKN